MLNHNQINEIYVYWKYHLQSSGIDWNNIKDDSDALSALYVLIKESAYLSSSTLSHSNKYGKISKKSTLSVNIKIDLSDLCKFTFDVIDICNEKDDTKRKIKKYSVSYNAIKAFILPLLKGIHVLSNEKKCVCLIICDLVRKTKSDTVFISQIKETIMANYIQDTGLYCPFNTNFKCQYRNPEDTTLCTYFKSTPTETQIKTIEQFVDDVIKNLSEDDKVLISNNGIIKIPNLVELK